MVDDRGPHGPSSSPSSGLRAAISAVLTPPGGFAAVPGDARELAACRCGHDPDEHRHWRRGTDCGRCGPGACTTYRPAGGTLRRLLHGGGRGH